MLLWQRNSGSCRASIIRLQHGVHWEPRRAVRWSQSHQPLPSYPELVCQDTDVAIVISTDTKPRKESSSPSTAQVLKSPSQNLHLPIREAQTDNSELRTSTRIPAIRAECNPSTQRWGTSGEDGTLVERYSMGEQYIHA